MEVQEETVANGDMFADYIEWRVEAPVRRPHDPAAQRRVRGRDTATTRTLTRQEVLTYTAVLAGAGNETTGRLIGWLAKLLAEHPDQRREVVEDRSLIPNVIDETLRFEPTGPHDRPLRHAGRRVLRHHRPGRQRRSCCSSASANRDPRRYDDPDVFDIHRDRRPAPHLRLRAPLLPRRQPRPARGPGRARRAAEPVPRVGRRLRRHEARPDVDGPRLGADAARPPLSAGGWD